MANDNFWGNLGGGLLSGAAGYMQSSQADKDARKKVANAQDPIFQQQQNLSGQAYGTATTMDPNALAKQAYEQSTALTDPGWDAKELATRRLLLKQGQYGVGTNAPVIGPDGTVVAASKNGPMNPQLAALYAAKEQANRKASFESMNQGQEILDRTLKRGGMLSDAAQRRQAQNMSMAPPSKPSLASSLLSGVGKSILSNPGMLKGAGDWLGGLLGGGGGGGMWGSVVPTRQDFVTDWNATMSMPGSLGYSDMDIWI